MTRCLINQLREGTTEALRCNWFFLEEHELGVRNNSYVEEKCMIVKNDEVQGALTFLVISNYLKASKLYDSDNSKINSINHWI